MQWSRPWPRGCRLGAGASGVRSVCPCRGPESGRGEVPVAAGAEAAVPRAALAEPLPGRVAGLRGRSPASCPRKEGMETARGSRGTGGQGTARLACSRQPKAAAPQGSRTPSEPGVRRSAAHVRGTLAPRHPQPCSAGGPSGCSERRSGIPLAAPSHAARVLGLSAMWGGPVPPLGSQAPRSSGDPAPSSEGPGGGHAVPDETVPAEFTGRFTNKKKVIWEKEKRSGGFVESAGFKEGGVERSKPLLCWAQEPSPHTAGAYGPSRPRTLPRGAPQLCPGPPAERGAPKATRRRGKAAAGPVPVSARRLSLLPGPKAAPGPGRSRRDRHGHGSGGAGGGTGRGALRRATQSCPNPGPGGEGEVHRVSRGQAAGLAAERGLFAGGGLQIRPRDRPSQARRTLRTLPASARGSTIARKVVLTPARARPEEERACAFRVCDEMLFSPPATAAG
ncbi:hypothetical protein Nmel_008042 [Mimus melanotis]